MSTSPNQPSCFECQAPAVPEPRLGWWPLHLAPVGLTHCPSPSLSKQGEAELPAGTPHPGGRPHPCQGHILLQDPRAWVGSRDCRVSLPPPRVPATCVTCRVWKGLYADWRPTRSFI